MSKLLLAVCLAAVASLGQCAGGWSVKAVDDEGVLRVANFAEDELNARSNSMFLSTIVTVTDAQSQVVAGLKWNITFDFGQTDCFKFDHSKLLKDCNVQRVEECQVIVLEQAWLKKTELLDFACHPKMMTPPPTRRMPGGVYPVDLDDAKLKEAVDFTWSVYEANDTCMFRSGVTQVVKAARQVVAGWKYFITMGMGYSNCPKTYVPKSDKECPLVDSVQDPACVNTECEVVVWDQPWRTPRYVMLSTLKCVPGK